MGNNVILEKVLENAKCLVNDRLNREKMALEKVQEALTIAECAIVEKEDALNREKAIREECNQLATTIGQVMEDAAQKVERNVNDIKKQYERQIKHLIHTQNEVRFILECLLNYYSLLRFRVLALTCRVSAKLPLSFPFRTKWKMISPESLETLPA